MADEVEEDGDEFMDGRQYTDEEIQAARDADPTFDAAMSELDAEMDEEDETYIRELTEHVEAYEEAQEE